MRAFISHYCINYWCIANKYLYHVIKEHATNKLFAIHSWWSTV